MSKQAYGFNEINLIVSFVSNYNEEHMEEQITSLSQRLEVVNQTVRNDEYSSDSLRLGKIQKQILILKEAYETVDSSTPLENKMNVMNRANEINKQLEYLEGKRR